jgi:hypothetical protein
MKILSNIINVAFEYVIRTSKKYNIDESHALRHSMQVYHYAKNIYNHELNNSPFLNKQKDIIMCSAILHDMCDKKYVNEKEAIYEMNLYMKNCLSIDKLEIINKIISTMSYSTVKKIGYPSLGEFTTAYHIVREADLLAGYDIDRCIIYQMMHENCNYNNSLLATQTLFESRMFTYISDNLFITEYSKKEAQILHNKALDDIKIIINL